MTTGSTKIKEDSHTQNSPQLCFYLFKFETLTNENRAEVSFECRESYGVLIVYGVYGDLIFLSIVEVF